MVVDVSLPPAVVESEGLTPTPFQRHVLDIPEEFSLFLGGGRGGGKSYAILFLIIRHAMEYGHNARILYVRQTFPAIRDFEDKTEVIFGQLWGNEAKYNRQSHVWRLPGGATFELGQLETQKHYNKYQGRSFTLIVVDEAGQYNSPELLDLLRSNLRGPVHIKTRMVYAANPGGAGHWWIAPRYALPSEGHWRPFMDKSTGVEVPWISVPSLYTDNPTIDQRDYAQQISAASMHDPELQRAWLTGDWTVVRGAFFSDVMAKVRQQTFFPDELRKQVRVRGGGASLRLAHDWGSAAPSATYLLYDWPGGEDIHGRYWHKGTVFVLDEYATYAVVGKNKTPNYKKGTGETPAQLAVGIKRMCERWNVNPTGVADDACFAKQQGEANASIAQEFRRAGVRFRRARKGDRISGWTIMRGLMANAGSLESPGLIVDPRCVYFWATVPSLVRHEKITEDIADNQPDHAADAVRYGLLWRGAHRIGTGRAVGTY